MKTIGEKVFEECMKAQSDAIENDKPFGTYEIIIALSKSLNKYGYRLRMHLINSHLSFTILDEDGDEITFRNSLENIMDQLRSPYFALNKPADCTRIINDIPKVLLENMSAEEQSVLKKIIDDGTKNTKDSADLLKEYASVYNALQEADNLFDKADDDIVTLAGIRDHMEAFLKNNAFPSEDEYQAFFSTIMIALNKVLENLLQDFGDDFEQWRLKLKEAGVRK
ncbi:MAG: hypothetical protein IKO25_00300 [Clostridia bacterium]|nr:hypothetical protein [Clostridia bacterium]